MSHWFEQSFGVENLLGGSNIAFFGVILVVLLIAASYLVINKTDKKVKSSWQQELVASKQKSSLSESDDAQADKTAATTTREDDDDDDMVVDDVWEQRRRRGITMPKSSISNNASSSSTTSKTSSSQGKPFGSSYYYAHNHLRAKGGYTDGLEPEDYTMNGPRLLSRNGQAVEKRKNNNTSGGVDSINTAQTIIKGENATDQQPEAQLSQPQKNVKVRRILNISKYLWDDPGDGTACIRIDQLPVSGSDSTTVNWGDVKVKNVTATLEGEEEEGGNGLIVLVETDEQVDYQLRIPQLYGKVSQVKTIIKPKKRLLVKLQKKVGLFDKSNAKAWPHPQKKKIL